jgi:formylglycine-generating enzyme required for sulfatase activity
MTGDVADKLRSLTQDYQQGRLDLAAYRALRAPLLDSLAVNGLIAAALAATEPRTGSWKVVPDGEVTRPGKLAPAAPGVTSSSSVSGSAALPTRKKSPVGAIVVLAVVLVAIGGVAFWLWTTHARGEHSAEGQAGASEANPLRDRIVPFMARADWSDAQLATLNAELLELGGSQIARVVSDTWFQRFVDELRRRLKEQQALAATTLTADNSPLAALAVTVGLDLNSPDAAIHIAALPPPPVEAPPIDNVSTSIHRVSLPATPKPAPQSAPSEPVPAPTPAHVEPSPQVSNATVAELNPCPAELIRSRRPLCHDTLPGGIEGPLLALVPAGSFDMGSTATAEEQPVHHVTLRQPFAISVYEVSQGEFKQYCERANKSCAQQPWSGDDYPVVNVSWDDGRSYAEWLSRVTHYRYSLPTEAQWEYAARAGRTGLFPSGDALSPTDALFSIREKQSAAARRAQKFNANAFRLVHTVGNVREWVEDGWSQNFTNAPSDGSAAKLIQAAQRVARGGSYTDSAARLRLSMREALSPGTRDVTTGFRIVRELP